MIGGHQERVVDQDNRGDLQFACANFDAGQTQFFVSSCSQFVKGDDFKAGKQIEEILQFPIRFDLSSHLTFFGENR